MFRILGGLMFATSSLGVLSSVVTLGMQLMFDDPFPELPIWATVFAGAMGVLMAYVGWRLMVATEDELKAFKRR